MSEHLTALQAVQRDTIGVPKCADRMLIEAERAGLLQFKSWPSGHWTLTPSGRAYLRENETWA